MSNSVIRAELESKLKTWATMDSIPIAFENVSFTKPANNGTYIECYLIPASVSNPTIDGTRTRSTGIFSVNIYSKEGVGSKAIEALANSIVQLFPLVPKSGSVSIERTPQVAKAFPSSDGYRCLPIAIEYRYEA